MDGEAIGMKLGVWTQTLGLVAVAVLLAGCGPKRPPAVATTSPSSSSRTTSGGTQPVDEGPDVRPLDNEGMLDSSMLSDASGEGGPLADIHFGLDEADLSAEAKSTLDQHAQWILAHPTVKVRVEGHCDERGTVEYNLALGDRRARAAEDYLVSRGVPPGRLSIVSYGKERPLDPGRDEAAWARNRRDHFNVYQ
jgi:peptidoglycan-associated lipoprotein